MTGAPVLVPLTAALAQVAAALHAAAGFDTPWDARSFADLLAMPGCAGLLGQVGEEPVGLVLWRVAADEAEILTFCVVPAHRRKHCGLALLSGALRALYAGGVQTVLLEVAVDNHGAIALYRKAGFMRTGLRRRYYGGARDALIMANQLDRGSEITAVC